MQLVARHIYTVIIFNLAISLFGMAYADGMQVKSGLWEITSTVAMPFGGGTQQETTQECIEDSEVTPETMMGDAQECQILDSDVSADSMQWTMKCQNQSMEMTGEGTAETSGDTITGGMNISATYNGQEMTMSTSWNGQYIGDCN